MSLFYFWQDPQSLLAGPRDGVSCLDLFPFQDFFFAGVEAAGLNQDVVQNAFRF